MIKQLTGGSWEVTAYQNSDIKGGKIFFSCNKNNPLCRFLYSLDMKSGNILQITDKEGSHYTQVNKTGNYILDVCSSISCARRIDLLDASGKTVQELLSDPNPLKDIKLGKMSIFTIRNSKIPSCIAG